MKYVRPEISSLKYKQRQYSAGNIIMELGISQMSQTHSIRTFLCVSRFKEFLLSLQKERKKKTHTIMRWSEVGGANGQLSSALVPFLCWSLLDFSYNQDGVSLGITWGLLRQSNIYVYIYIFLASIYKYKYNLFEF